LYRVCGSHQSRHVNVPPLLLASCPTFQQNGCQPQPHRLSFDKDTHRIAFDMTYSHLHHSGPLTSTCRLFPILPRARNPTSPWPHYVFTPVRQYERFTNRALRLINRPSDWSILSHVIYPYIPVFPAIFAIPMIFINSEPFYLYFINTIVLLLLILL
jgi:hypothetical protein